ncbi:MAG: ATP-NAD kinase [Verrucomicrobia bacterium]|nr:ATP-NAD kinase [Verrucomicrobiota bacterium]
MKNTELKTERIGLVANPGKPVWKQAIEQARQLVEATGRKVVYDDRTLSVEAFQTEGIEVIRNTASQSDILIVFGGDGTMLHAARSLQGIPTPLLGINTGGLGFLTAAPVESLEPTLNKVWKGELSLDKRSYIRSSVSGKEGKKPDLTAVNDLVISRGMASRMIELEVIVDDQLLTQYRCDGFIISTPTGSTAYSLSAGGAVVSPNANVFILTPICPHTLSNRSIIVDMQSTIEVRILSQRVETVLTADGQKQIELAPHDLVRIHAIPDQVQLLNLPENSFFNILRQKLHWSGSHVERPKE